MDWVSKLSAGSIDEWHIVHNVQQKFIPTRKKKHPWLTQGIKDTHVIRTCQKSTDWELSKNQQKKNKILKRKGK